jgi:phosphoglycolate phosphatase
MTAPPDSPIRFLLFDLDGTLVETLTDIAGSVNHALVRLGLPPRSMSEVRAFVGRGVERLIARALGEEHAPLAGECLALFREHYGVHCLDNSRLLPGAREILEKFADRSMAVVSNKPERYVVRMLEGLDIARHFPVVFGGDSVEEKKPSPLMVRAALRRFDLDPTEGILVGDMPVDVETGRAAGVHTVSVLGGFADREELEAAGPDRIAENLYEVARLFY